MVKLVLSIYVYMLYFVNKYAEHYWPTGRQYSILAKSAGFQVRSPCSRAGPASYLLCDQLSASVSPSVRKDDHIIY